MSARPINLDLERRARGKSPLNGFVPPCPTLLEAAVALIDNLDRLPEDTLANAGVNLGLCTVLRAAVFRECAK